ncbi:MAG: glycine cleavage system protein GcvH [Elusimicrobia bacterium]|nr:glycine cleavage system protein GcvH [Elusimicrobiota bacterium]
MEIYFTKEHEWISVKQNVGTVGITEYAVEKLGDITYVDLPEIGTEVKQGETLCEVESVKAASEVYAPVSGKVLEVNARLENSPEIINSSPLADGWIVRMEILNKDELKNLMNREEYEKFISTLS